MTQNQSFLKISNNFHHLYLKEAFSVFFIQASLFAESFGKAKLYENQLYLFSLHFVLENPETRCILPRKMFGFYLQVHIFTSIW